MGKRGAREGYRLYRSGSRTAQARNPEEIGIERRRLCPIRARLNEEDDGATAKWALAVSCRREGKVALGLLHALGIVGAGPAGQKREGEVFFLFFLFLQAIFKSI